MRRPWRIAAVLVFAACLAVGGLFGDRLLALTDETRDALRLYTELLTVAHERYGAEVSYRDLVYASINGMLRTLDPHSSFLSPEAYASMREKQQASFYGLGILVGMRNGQLTIITPIEGTPASRMGLRAGDVIHRIEGEPTEALSLDEAVQRLKGPKGTKVAITVVRRGLDEPLELTITRDEIPQDTVRYSFMIAPGTGYIALTDFARATGSEMSKAIRELKAQGMNRLLLDLRANGGGLLDQAIDVADQFVPKGTKIVETRGRTRDSFQSFYAAGRYPELEIPVVVLVSSGTASAAEILAGAIQDHDIGLIAGTPTWGKGLVQTVYSLSYDAGLALTTARYYTPSGRLIQRDYTSWYDYYQYGDQTADADADRRLPDEQQQFLTDLGRRVYGGGGITPDVVIQPMEIAPFLQYLLSRNALFDFAVDYANRHQVKRQDWKPAQAVLGQFGDWLVAQSLATGEEVADALASPQSGEWILRQIRAEVLNSAFGLEARYRVLAEGDTQIEEALKLFNEASDLLAQRQRLDDDDRQTATSS